MNFTTQKRPFFLVILSISLIAWLFTFSSCEKEKTEVIEKQSAQEKDDVIMIPSSLKCSYQRGWLIDYELVAEYPLEVLQSFAAELEPLVRYGIRVYKVSYFTEYKGRIIRASGAIGVPDMPRGERAPITVYNHWTMYSAGDTLPSTGMEIITLLTTAYGNITFAPDYIGFGDSKDIFHPYAIEKPTTDAVIDMMFAGRQFLFKERIMPKFRLFMFGLSQGGLASVGAQKEIENNPYYKHRIHLTAVASGSGVYKITDLMHNMITAENYPAPSYIPFFCLAYNEYYGFGKNPDDMFKNSYGQLFLDMKEQEKGYFDINPMLPTAIGDLLQDDFRADLIAGITEFNAAALQNNVDAGWAPKAPLNLFHSEADDMVPYSNALNAYNTFVAAGSNSVELVTLPPADHLGSMPYNLFYILTWFESMQ